MQMYLVFPLLRRLVHGTRRWHGWLLAAAAVYQVGFYTAVQHHMTVGPHRVRPCGSHGNHHRPWWAHQHRQRRRGRHDPHRHATAGRLRSLAFVNVRADLTGLLRRHGDRDQEAGGPSVPIQSGCAAVKAATVSSRIAWNSCRVVLSRISTSWPPITAGTIRTPLVFANGPPSGSN